jgi:hypothetical protein
MTEKTLDVKKILREGDLTPLVVLFRTQSGDVFKPVKGQMEIIERIVSKSPKWISVNAYTGYGKSDSISIGLILLAIASPGEKIYIVAPTYEKAKIIMRYIGRHLGDHTFFMSQLSSRVRDRAQLLSGEVSQSFRSFSNGSTIQILSADIGKMGEGAMGEGGTFIAIDEVEAIPIEIVQNKIVRMRRTEDSAMLLIGNPTTKGYLYRSMTDPLVKDKWHHIHIGWRQGVTEKRTTQKYIDDMAAEYGGFDSIGFRIMFESEYPTDYEDTLIPYDKIMGAVSAEPTGKIIERRLGVDPAHLGSDEAVLIDVDITSDGFYIAHSMKIIPKCTVPELITAIRQRFVSSDKSYDKILIDYQGEHGVVDGLKDKYPDMKRKVIGIKHGATAPGATKHGEPYSNLFQNTKSRNYWHLRDLFLNGLIKIPRDEILIDQLLGWKYEPRKQTGKIFVIDPTHVKSPDRSDALVFGCAPIIRQARYMSKSGQV